MAIPQGRTAFTLSEILVVLGILSILMSLLLPAVHSAREAARRLECSNKVRQISLGLILHEATLKRYPVGHRDALDRNSYRTWLSSILPYVEQKVLSDRIEQAYLTQSSPYGHVYFDSPISLFACSSDPRVRDKQLSRGTSVALTSYVGVSGIDFQSKDGVLINTRARTNSEITDGTSNTLFVAERPPSPDFWFGWWYAGNNSEQFGALDTLVGSDEKNRMSAVMLGGRCQPSGYSFQREEPDSQCGVFHYWSMHLSGANFSKCDGSVSFLSYGIDPRVMRSLSTIAGGETVSEP
jgi:prepilin-type N-terminal cleavage/methylation domain-containing protein